MGYEAQAKLAILNKMFKTAEGIYLENNDLDAAMKMYQDLLKWDEGKIFSIKLFKTFSLRKYAKHYI